MSDYQRPIFPTKIHHDEHGLPIDYGNRWEGDSPHGEAYSRLSNLQRFLPLHTVALALIEWLQSTFDVDIEQTPSAAVALINVPDDVVQAVRIGPRNPDAAPLTFVLTGFPTVFLHAGLLHDFHFPSCACDACDEDLTSMAEDLEWTVRTVVAGGYSERFSPWPGRWTEFKLVQPGDRMQGGGNRAKDLPKDRVKFARTALPPEGQWLPWQKLPQGNTGAHS
jgi:hypothetical protein